MSERKTLRRAEDLTPAEVSKAISEGEILTVDFEGGKTRVPPELPYWPYCTTCHEPYDFDKEEPFAYCKCGTSEWGHPRPASWIPDPRKPAAGNV